MKQKPFVPTDNPRILKRIKKAAETNAARDKVDIASGGTPPYMYPPSLQARTVISALVAALGAKETKRPEKGWEMVAEGLVMLVQLEVALRQLDDKIVMVQKMEGA